jgi:prolipoprotein diacylglyceryltransferase
MVANGFGRVFIESLRRNPEVALGMTEPQWIGIGLIVAGIGFWLYYRKLDRGHDALAASG